MIPPTSLFLRMCPPINPLDLDTQTQVEILKLASEMVAYLYPDEQRATMREDEFCVRLVDLCILLATCTPVKVADATQKTILQLFEVQTVTQASAWLFNFFTYGYSQRDMPTGVDYERVRTMQIYRHLAEREGVPLTRSAREHFTNA